MPQYLRSRIKNISLKGKLLPILVILVVALVGTKLLIGSHAANPYASVTADQGTAAGSATVSEPCSGSSDGSCVVFGGSSTAKLDCFASPGKCGYPDPAYSNVGASSCSTPTPVSGDLTINGSSATLNGQPFTTGLSTKNITVTDYTYVNGTLTPTTTTHAYYTLSNFNLDGTITIAGQYVALDNVCSINSGNSGAFAAVTGSGAGNIYLEHSTFAGSAASGNGVLDTGFWNAEDASGITAEAIYIYNAAEDWHGSGTVSDSYMQAGATFSEPNGTDGCDETGGCPSHNEDVYLSDTSWTGYHNTLFNSTDQTAVLFGDNDGGSKDIPADNNWIVYNSLMAGGGYLMYLDAQNGDDPLPVGSSTMDIENNRFARCKTTSVYDSSSGGNYCSGGTDSYGYWPNGGYFGGPVDDYCGDNGQIWSNNVWDDNNAGLSC